MHKKLSADLTSLAHSILQMKNKEDVFALKNKAHELYEKLSVLAYVEEYINNTPNPEHTKEELIEAVENASKQSVTVKAEEVVEKEETVDDVLDNTIENVLEKEESQKEVVKHELLEEETEVEIEPETEVEKEEIVEVENVEEPKVEKEENKAIDLLETDLFSEEKKEEKTTLSLDDELKDTIAVDVVADLFENTPKKSLNDKLQGDIQIGLNDRIAFVKNLFGGSQEDFNRVVSQLNTFKTEKEAKKFISKMVKPDYDWTEKEEFEERFMNIVERKFA